MKVGDIIEHNADGCYWIARVVEIRGEDVFALNNGGAAWLARSEIPVVGHIDTPLGFNPHIPKSPDNHNRRI